MNTTLSPTHCPATLLNVAFPALGTSRPVRTAVLVVLGSLALAISAKLQFTLGPVPFTMQTCVVLMLGALLGKRLAGASVALYLVEGLAGLPVFAAGGGIAYLASPTFGYLVGFLPAAILIGHLTERGYGRTLAGSLAVIAAGHALIFVFGLLWLTPAFGLVNAYWVGLHAFWAMSVIKTVLAALSVTWAWKHLASGNNRT